MDILDEIRNALDDQQLMMENLQSLNSQQQCQAVQYILNHRLPLIIHTEKGDITITSVIFTNDLLNIYGTDIIKDPGTSDNTWHVIQNNPPIWVRDDASTDRIIEYQTGEIFGYRLDPVQAAQEMLVNIVRQQT